MKMSMKGLSLVAAGFVLGAMTAPMGQVQGQTGPKLADGALAHLGFAVKDADKSAKDFGELFGVDVPKTMVIRDVPWGPRFPGKTMNVKFVQFTAHGVRYELLEGLDGDSPWKDHIATHGEGLHHLGISVPDLPAARAMLLAKGGKVTQAYSEMANYVDMEPRWPFTIELVAAPPAAAK
jgi:methylmalonyl-CoA/ethylmalonyl-CoA epimerase